MWNCSFTSQTTNQQESAFIRILWEFFSYKNIGHLVFTVVNQLNAVVSMIK